MLRTTANTINTNTMQCAVALRPSRRHYSSHRMTFTGNVATRLESTPEERMTRVFGGRLKGEPPKSTSRYVVPAETARTIAGVAVPHRPLEPDNCCMSGCVNCVWEYFNEDIRHWQAQRKRAAARLHGSAEVWPQDWDPPLALLDSRNVPGPLQARKRRLDNERQQSVQQVDIASLFPKRTTPLPESVVEAKRRNLLQRKQNAQQDEDNWRDIPVYIRVFAEFERTKRLQRQRERRSKH